MNYVEKRMNLFEVDDSYHLAHCISSDCMMGAGIAVDFQKKYKLRFKLLSRPFKERKHPACIRIGKVYNLITKKFAVGKPTYDSLEQALILMRNQMLEEGVYKIAMPKIGSGLDRLHWPRIREIIKEVFKDTDIEILICYL